MASAPSTERRVLVPTQLTRAQLHGVSSGYVLVEAEGATMGTYWAVKAFLPPPAQSPVLSAIVQGAFDEVVRQMSGWSETSNLTRFNRAVAQSWHVLPREFFEVLSRAVEIARDSAGAYDPTVGEVVELLGFGPAGPDVPSSAENLQAAQRRVGWGRLALDPEGLRAFQPGSLRVDLSSIAKGYGVDLACERLIEAGIDNFLVEVGGEVRGRGCKPDGQPWWCWVERPPQGPDAVILPETVVALCDVALATSGSYRRKRDESGKVITHLIDPRTGVSSSGDLVSVTVLASTCMDADGYATALYVLGADEGLAWAEARGLAALFVELTPRGPFERWTAAWGKMLE